MSAWESEFERAKASRRAADGIVERLPLGLDMPRLRSQVEEIVRYHPVTWQSAYYGGWSLYSRTGEYTDGWKRGHTAFKRDGSASLDEVMQILEGFEEEYRKPTQLCTGYLGEILGRIEKLGLWPYRARIAVLVPGGATARHRDGLDGQYRARLHIPVMTNPGAFFRTDEGQVHMPADGDGYFVSVARWHQAVNNGDKPRLHLYMGVYDTAHITERFIYPPRREI